MMPQNEGQAWTRFRYNGSILRGRWTMKNTLLVICFLLLGSLMVTPEAAFGAYGVTPCSDCHQWDACNGQIMDCGTCHAVPPDTGAHLAHFSGTVQQAEYGDTRITEEFSALSSTNIIGCGNCHPLDRNSHGNEVSGEVELYNPAAPAGSIKALNTTASYDPVTKTCSNVYCHSANQWTTDGPVATPWPPLAIWDPAVDPLPRPLPDNIVTTRVYKDIAWDSGVTLGCDGCHDNPPQTSYVDNAGGSGDSHYWNDDWGYENLHVWNMGYDPLSCRTCHYATVQDPSPWQVDPATSLRVYNDVAIFNKARHVNGTADVVFDTVNGFSYVTSSYGTRTYLLQDATYDPVTKTCSDVGCHGGINGLGKKEDKVMWGLPYRWWSSTECDRCHGYY